MKKISVFVFALVCLLVIGQAIAATPGNRQSPGVGDILGQGGLDSEGNKIFRLVRFVPLSGSHISVGLTADSIVVWDLVSNDGVTVTSTTTSSDSAVAGIIVTNVLTPEYGSLGNNATQDIGKRNWGWLQTYGKSQADFAGSAVLTAGWAIGTSTETGKATGYAVTSTAASNAANMGKAGFTYDAVTAGLANVSVFLNLD